METIKISDMAPELVEIASESLGEKVDVVKLLANFFNQVHIIERFNVFNIENISGWENWFQIELAYFLHHHVTVQDREWWREFNIKWDGMPADMGKCKPDFWLWAGEKDSFYLLELKQNANLSTALNGVAEDIKKLSTLTNDKKFNAIGYKREYICKGKFFALVSKVNPESNKTPVGVTEAYSGSIGNNGYHFVIYSTCE
ncbi:hypothetical protein [Xenorhabdus lircayensis]|uniref:Uncharacterized protein n=1 Tax=Xenorhabdus lircayensis TaxID=2763499 RepID=A0ABS0U2N4_9GAMM|nr:hypothetical protein [Xenorhabdus lircayensis]MBI6548127.1 hypothetical protein [Xenorhabdus lircayensis]